MSIVRVWSNMDKNIRIALARLQIFMGVCQRNGLFLKALHLNSIRFILFSKHLENDQFTVCWF